ncbi:MAG: hypothetical protein GXO04_03090 [Aquificae bacterium]|nr:hypothetical protein [Aquificota bacterium]
MGIFIEDLLHFGNLIDNEVGIELSPAEFKKAFPSLEFSFSDSLVIIRGKKKILFFPKSYEVRAKEESSKVYNDRKDELTDFGVYLRLISSGDLDELLKDERIKREGEYLRLSVLDALKNSEVYNKIPRQIRPKLKLTRYKVKKGNMTLYLTVVK